MLLARFRQLEKLLPGLGVLHDRSGGHLQDNVGAVLPLAERAAAGRPVLRLDMLAVFQVNQRPELRIRPQDDVSAPAAVTAVRSAFRNIFRPVQMHRTRAAVAGCAIYLDVVYEIGFCHNQDANAGKDTEKCWSYGKTSLTLS